MTMASDVVKSPLPSKANATDFQTLNWRKNKTNKYFFWLFIIFLLFAL